MPVDKETLDNANRVEVLFYSSSDALVGYATIKDKETLQQIFDLCKKQTT